MPDSVSSFLAELHRDFLKSRGYRKTRHTFSRQMSGYTERVQFQGSSWNSSSGPWTCYVNFGVEFPDLSARHPARDFPATHCWTRLEQIVDGAPSQFEVGDCAENAISPAEITDFLGRASQQVARQIAAVRASYQRTLSPRLLT